MIEAHPELLPSADEVLLDELQHGAFRYFLEQVNPRNGLVADTSRPGSPVSIAVVGFALASYPVGVERGWMTRAAAIERTLAALRFFRDSDQSGLPESTGHKGFYYHFLDPRSGKRAWRSELSMIDTTLLIAGALAAGEYFDEDTPDECALRELVALLYRRVDWRWAQDGACTIRLGWKPECGFLHYRWEGYCEALLLYVLALGSPTHPMPASCHQAWTDMYQWEHLYGLDLLCAGPLFMHQFSHAWIDLRGVRDRFMRDKRSDYFENSRHATYVQREYARRNPREFAGYDELCWGLSACDGPGDATPGPGNEHRQLLGYSARGAPFGPDDGTLSAPAALASMPFAPELALPTVRKMIERYPEMKSDWRLASGFNPSVPVADRGAWVSAGHFGLDQGIVVLMLENHRSELPWRLMRRCPHVVTGLRRAGFRGGWL